MGGTGSQGPAVWEGWPKSEAQAQGVKADVAVAQVTGRRDWWPLGHESCLLEAEERETSPVQAQ